VPSAKAHPRRGLFRSAEALLALLKQGAATVTPQLCRDEGEVT